MALGWHVRVYDARWHESGPLLAVLDTFSYLRWHWRLSEVGEWELGLQDDGGACRIGRKCELWYRQQPVAAGLVLERRRGRGGLVVLGASAEALLYELGIPAQIAPRGRNRISGWLPGSVLPGDYVVDMLTRPCRVWSWCGDAWSQCTITNGQVDTDGLSVKRTANPLTITSPVVDTGYSSGLVDHVYVAWRWQTIAAGPVTDTVEVRTGSAPDALGAWAQLPAKVRWWVTRPAGDTQSGAVVWGYAASGPNPVSVQRYVQVRASFSGGWQDGSQTTLSPVWADAMGLLYAGAPTLSRSLATGLPDVALSETHEHLSLPALLTTSLKHAGMAWRISPGGGNWALTVAARDTFPVSASGVALVAGENEGLDQVTVSRRQEVAGIASLVGVMSPENYSGQPNSPSGMSLERNANMQVHFAEHSPAWPTLALRSTAVRHNREDIGTGSVLQSLRGKLGQAASDSGLTVLRCSLSPALWTALVPGDLCVVTFPQLGRRAQGRVVELLWDISASRCEVVAGVAVDRDAFLEGEPAGPAALPIATSISEVA